MARHKHQHHVAKATDVNLDEGHSFPKSLRHIKSKWRGRENKIDEKNSLITLENKFDDYEKNSEHTSYLPQKFNIPSINQSTNPTTIGLDASSAIESLKKLSQSIPEKRKRKMAFHTIKSYLEKNKSDQNIDSNETLENSSDNIPNINCYTKSSSTVGLSLNRPETIFRMFNTIEYKSNIGDSLMNETGNINKDEDLSSKTTSSSEVSSEIITISNIPLPSLKNHYIPKIVELTDKLPKFNYQTKMVSLYVGDLDKSVSEIDLYNFFSKYPGLISVKIPLNTVKNESLGYGYVNFNNQENADFATEGLNYSKLKGSEIRILPSLRDKNQREKVGANIFFSNLSSNLSSRTMFDRLKNYGKILSCKYSAEKSTCFVHFFDKLEAYKICKQFNQTKMDDKIISVSVHISKKEREIYQASNFKLLKNIDDIKSFQPSIVSEISRFSNISNNSPIKNINTTEFANEIMKVENKNEIKNKNKPMSTQYSIFMRNLPLDLKQEVIKNLVEPYGTVKNILTRNVPAREGSWALITMTNRDAVERAINNLNAIEIEGKQLFVTRAIPREEKDYAKREENYPKKKLKILISGLNSKKDCNEIKNWCSNCNSIRSAEFYISSNEENENGYGYIEINDDNEIDFLINQLKKFKVSCYKIKIEIPSLKNNFESQHYPYLMNTLNIDENKAKLKPLPFGVVSFSYIDPNKMSQIANFQKEVDSDKINVLQNLENFNKLRIKNSNNNDNGNVTESDENLLKEKQNEIYHTIWEIIVRLFRERRSWRNKNYNPNLLSNNKILSRSKVTSLTDHLVKFFWANNFEEFYKFVKKNQFDENNRIIFAPHPILANQILQSATYLGIIPK